MSLESPNEDYEFEYVFFFFSECMKLKTEKWQSYNPTSNPPSPTKKKQLAKKKLEIEEFC